MAQPVPEDELHEPYATYAKHPAEEPGTEQPEAEAPDCLRLLRQTPVPALSAEEAFEVFSAAAPEGWRVELIEGDIHVTPPANGEHEEIVSELSGQVRDHRKDLGRYTGIGLFVPGASKSGKVEPDLVLAPKGSFADQEEYHDPSPVLMVVEVTSPSTGDNDRRKKILGYARAGIPVYLLIDREAGQVVVHSQPEGDKYTSRVAYELSAVVPLPEPLGFDLDTGQF
ncbi:Uma2 family endonuclease [Streptomyces thermoalcalitolerans]|uniref:Putative restriction endonuclease domain-containing protein n=1 Tax=Streptomyces thermoalcalitolerans TaxID=65605 RepID=A0ABP3YSK7_9ACTN